MSIHRTLKTIFITILVVGAMLVAGTFAWLNPGSIELDLAVRRVEVSRALAFAVCFAAGWLLGAGSAGLFVLRLVRERRRLRRSLRAADAEAQALRQLPQADADTT